MAEAARLDELADSLPVQPAEAVDVGGADVGVAAEPAEARPVAEPPSISSDDDVDPLDRLLAQWDAEQKAGNGAAASGDDDIIELLNQDAARQQYDQELAAAQRYANELAAHSAMEIARRDQQVAELNQTVGQLQNVIAQEQWRQHQLQSRDAFEKVVAAEQAKLADVPGIDEDHARRWLLSEAAQDPRLGEVWEISRFYEPPGPVDRARVASHIQAWAEGQAKLALQLPDPRARVLAQQNIESSMRQMWETAFPDPAAYRANAAKYVNQALDRMHKEARKPRLDPDRTSDYFAVAQAVRGASTRTPPPEIPPGIWRTFRSCLERVLEAIRVPRDLKLGATALDALPGDCHIALAKAIKRNQIVFESLNDGIPIRCLFLSVQLHSRVPRAISSVQKPTPVSVKAIENPCRFTYSPRQMRRRGIDRNYQVQVFYESRCI